MKTEIKDHEYDKILEVYLKYRTELTKCSQTGGNIKTLITNAKFIENNRSISFTIFSFIFLTPFITQLLFSTLFF